MAAIFFGKFDFQSAPATFSFLLQFTQPILKPLFPNVKFIGWQQKGKGGGCRLEIEFSEEYGGHELSAEHPLAQCALAAMTDIGLTASSMSWRGFNAGCEAGLRWGIDQTPTLVWGPGSLEQAHGMDEFVELKAVHEAARSFALCAIHWTTLPVK